MPDEVLLSPDGTQALVRAARNVFMITVPPVGGEAPTVSVSASSSVPTRRLTRVGGDFVGWRNDGNVAYYSIGRSFFQYDLGVADSLLSDSLMQARASAVDEPDEPDEPDSTQTEAEVKPAIAYEAARVDVEIVMPKDKPQGTVVLSGARVITMRGDEIIEGGDIVVRDNRIVAVMHGKHWHRVPHLRNAPVDSIVAKLICVCGGSVG